MGKGSNTTTQQTTTSPNPQAMASYQDVLNRAQGVSQLPYTPYTGELVAGVNPQQYQGIGNINQYALSAQPAIQTAEGMAYNAAQPITAADINQYVSPYTQDVVNATQAQFANQNAQQMQGVKGNAIAQGALGGNREAIAEAETANQQQLAQAPVIAGLENQGYQTGLNTALTEQQALASGAYGLGNLGVSGENAALTGANAQIGAGSLEQGTQQALDAALLQQFQNQQAFPYQQTQWLAGINSGIGSQMGGTSYGTTTAPPPSTLGQIAGIGTAGVGLLGGTGAFGSSGWLAPAVMALASGGAVSKGIAPNEHTVPESYDTLVAQQKQLVDGHRRVHMFPHGTRELNMPHGMGRVEGASGVFHYNPKVIDANQIRLLASHGKENELLDLGPISKDEVLARMHRGEIPLAIVERQPDGTEVRTAAGTHATVHRQMEAMHHTKSPGNHLRVEDPRAVLAHRRKRAVGGRVQGFDTGGGVAGTPYAGGVDLTHVPGWIPSMNIVHGSGAPHVAAPAPAPNQLAQQAQQVGALAKAITGAMKGGPSQPGQPQNISPVPVGATPVGAPPIMGVAPAFSPTDQTGSAGGIYNRGGSVGRYASSGIANLPFNNRITMPRGYADGGGPDSLDDPATDQFGPFLPVNSFNERSDLGLPTTGGVGLAAQAPLDASIPSPDNGGLALAAGVPFKGDEPVAGIAGAWHGEPPAAAPALAAATDVGIAPGSNAGIAALERRPQYGTAASMVAQGETGDPHLGYKALSNISPDTNGSKSYGFMGLNSHSGSVADFVRENPQFGLRAQPGTPAFNAQWRAAAMDQPSAFREAQLQYFNDKHVASVSRDLQKYGVPPEVATDPRVVAYFADRHVQMDTIGLPNAAVAWDKSGGNVPQFLQNMNSIDRQNMPSQFRSAIASGVYGTRGNETRLNTRLAGALGADGGETFPAGDNEGVANTRVARNTESDLPPKSRVAEAASPTGAAPASGIDLSGNSKLWPALAAAGFGMMASRSPFPGVAIGEGGQQGLASYTHAAELEQQHALKQSEIDIHAKNLQRQADQFQQELAHKTSNESQQLEEKRREALERERDRTLALAKPIVVDKNRYGQPIYGRMDQKGNLLNLDGTPYTGTAKEDANANLTGEELIKSLPAGDQAAVRKIGSYDLPLPSVNSRSPRAQYLFDMAVQAYPDLNAAEYPAILAATRKFYSGQNADQIRSFDVAVSHLDTLQRLGDAMKNGNYPLINQLSNWWKTNTGQEAPVDFNAAKRIVSDEIVKAVIGARGALGDRKTADDALSSASSHEQLKGVINTYKNLMAGQLDGYRRQFVETTHMPVEAFNRRLAPETQTELESHSNRALPSTTSPAATAPPTGAVEMLRKNPNLASQFDAKYGTGAAARVLGQ